MKVTVERAELLKSLGHVHRVVERRNTIPILANIVGDADGDRAAAHEDDHETMLNHALTQGRRRYATQA